MISSTLTHEEQVLEHEIRGSLCVRDIAEFTRQANALDTQAVVWNLSKAVLELDDDTYAVSITSTSRFVQRSVPRLVLTDNPAHYFRIHSVLTAVNPPFAWKLFDTREKLNAWLADYLVDTAV